LVLLALVKPFDTENGNRYIGMVLAAVIAVAWLRTLNSPGQWLDLRRRYGVEAGLLAALIVVYLVSLLVHLPEYPGWFDVVAFGTPQMTLLSMFGMAWMVFRDRSRSEAVWPAWLILLALNGIALLQAVNFDLVAKLTSWSVAADIGRPDVSSMFRRNTIYGIVAALVVVYGTGQVFFGTGSLRWKTALLLLVVAAFLGGTLSESRSFFSTFAIGLLVLVAYASGRRPMVAISILLVSIVAFHAVVWTQPKLGKDYGRILPYMGKLERAAEIELKDFVPVVTNRTLANRANHWRHAWKAWQANPLLGIGPGVFRMNDLSVTGQKSVTNPHNIFLQTLVDTGLVGLLVLLALLGRVIWRIRDPVAMAVFLALVGGHLFENLFDKSIGFVLIAAWLLSESAPTSLRAQLRSSVSPENPVRRVNTPANTQPMGE
jgi:O-antigen ligase